MTETKNANVRKLTESALMIAVATILSIFKLVELPYGGSITLASMLPVILISYRHGLGWGIGTGLTHGVVQQLIGLKNLSYFTTPGSVIAIILLDYIVAFGVCGLGGGFRRCIKRQNVALMVGAAVVCVLRYICHTVSGATVWAGLSIPTAGAIGYSLIYNATYMIPETIVTVLVAYYIGSLLDFRREMPGRIVREKTASRPAVWCTVATLTIAFAAVVYCVVAVFSHLQNADTGEFDITLLHNANLWISVVAVTVFTVTVAIALLLVRRRLTKKDTDRTQDNDSDGNGCN